MFQFILILKSRPNRAILLNNASYHWRKNIEILNIISIKIFNQTKLHYRKSFTKRQLLALLRTKSFDTPDVVDRLILEYEHTMVNIPSYFCIFNPTEKVN